MSKRWEFSKPWCLAGLSLSGCIRRSVLQILEARAKLQPAPALQKHRSSAWLTWLSGPNTPNPHRVSTSHVLLMGTEGWGVIFSTTLVLVQSGKVRAEHCAKCVPQLTFPRLPWADLFCVCHCVCWPLGAELEGWLSALVRIGIPCAQPCTSNRVNSPSANHAAANAGSLLLP